MKICLVLLCLIVFLIQLASCDYVFNGSTNDSTSKSYPAFETTTSSGNTIYSKTPMNTVPISLWNYELKWSSRSVLVKNYTRTGDSKNGYTYIVDGYWEISGNNWEWRDHSLRLSEKSFGYITVTKSPDYEIR